MRGRIALLVLLALASTSARGQEQDYNEDRVRLAKVPPQLVQKAEKEAPGVRFATVYRDQEKGHRLVGKKDDGSTVSVRFDRDGRLTTVRTSTDVTLPRVPKPVASALEGEIRRRPELSGFKSLRSSLVDVFDAFKNENSSFYEFFGINGKNLYYRAEIGKEGEVRGVKDILLHPSYHIQRQSFAPGVLSPEMRQSLSNVATLAKITRVVKQISTKSGLPPDYFVYGRDEKNRAVEIRAHSNGSVHTVIREIPLADVPMAALDDLKSFAERDKALKGFRPDEARQMKLLALNGDVVYLFYGDDADGKAVEVQVRDDGTVSVSADDRDDWEVSTPSLASGDAVPARGFAVLAARFGREGRWVDVTDHVRSAISGGRLDFQPKDLPDPTFGSPKGLVIAYSINGKVGLSTTKDSQKVELPPPAAESKGAEIPPEGFAVLAARYGAEEKWGEATDVVRAKVSGGRLEVKVPSLNLPDPLFGVLKAMAMVYSINGKVGLAVIPEDRAISLPPQGPTLK